MDITTFLYQHHTKQTARSYSRAIDHFLFHSVMKERSTYMDIVHYLSDYKFQSPRVISAIKRYFDYLHETGQRMDHPCRSMTIKRPRKSIQFQSLFTKEELESLLDRKVRYAVLKDRDKSIISLLIYQGLTPANIENLRVQDIDIENGTIYIRATSKLSRRTLELKAQQVIQLYRYIQETRPKLKPKNSESLFIGKLGNRFTVETLNRMLRPLQKEFRIKKLNALSIRQSVIAYWLNDKKIPLEDVQLLSGQKWMSTTEKYIRPEADKKRELINQYFPI